MKRSFPVDGRAVDVDLPDGDVTPSAVLPALYALVDASVARIRSDRDAAGTPIQCRAGCAACCRQLVPVAEPEMRHLAHVVASMPEEAQGAVLRRFAAARDRLLAAGLFGPLTNPPPEREAHAPLLQAYFRLGIPCPFLDESEKCSIYHDRPAICREYNVTSPPVRCAAPFTEILETVLPRRNLANVLGTVLGGLLGRKVRIGPMALMFDHLARAEPEPLAPAANWFDPIAKALGEQS